MRPCARRGRRPDFACGRRRSRISASSPTCAPSGCTLFALRAAPDAFDPRDCRCRSFFGHYLTGRPTPEADAYAWKAIADSVEWAGKGLVKVLARIDWASLDTLPEEARIEVDTESPTDPGM